MDHLHNDRDHGDSRCIIPCIDHPRICFTLYSSVRVHSIIIIEYSFIIVYYFDTLKTTSITIITTTTTTTLGTTVQLGRGL